MAKILLAASQEARVFCAQVLVDHDLVVVRTLSEAERRLEENGVDLILCTVLFDDSRMFELLRFVKGSRKHKKTPFVCGLFGSKVLNSVALEAVKIASETLGATEFIDFNEYLYDVGRLRKKIEQHLPVRAKRSGDESK